MCTSDERINYDVFKYCDQKYSVLYIFKYKKSQA